MALGVTLGALGCARPAVPDPQPSVRAYSEALEKGDAHALRQLLTEGSRKDLSERDVARLLRENRAELMPFAVALGACALEGSSCERKSEARLVFADGSQTRLALEDASFKLDGAGSLPARPATPEAALTELRLAIERRSLAGVLGLLPQSKRAELVDTLDVLAQALGGLDLALVETRGDRAEVELPGGVRVLLRRERGAWWIEDIE